MASLMLCFVMPIMLTGCRLPWPSFNTGGTGGLPPSTQEVPIFPNGDDYAPNPGYQYEDTGPPIEVETDNTSFIEAIQGIRAVYSNATATPNEQLTADKEKFYNNVTYQYHYIAEYLIYSLLAKYGASAGVNHDIDYQYYADTSFLSEETRVNMTHNINGVPNVMTLDTAWANSNILAITSPVVNITFTEAHQPTFVSDEAYAWLCNITDTQQINTYIDWIAYNLLCYANGVNSAQPNFESYKNNITGYQSISQGIVQNVQTLGVPSSQEFFDYISQFVKKYIIGDTAYDFDNDTTEYNYMAYYTEIAGTSLFTEKLVVSVADTGYLDNTKQLTDDPTKYEWYYQKNGTYYDADGAETTDPDVAVKVGVDLYQVIYKYYDYSTGQVVGATNYQSVQSYSEAGKFKHGYATTLATIVDTIKTFSANFPHYSNYEFATFEPDKYYEAEGIGDYSNYQDYTSAIIFPNGVVVYDEENDYSDSCDTTQKLWQFDLMEISLVSTQSLCIDVYLRLHIDGEDKIYHLCRTVTIAGNTNLNESASDKKDSFYTEYGDTTLEYLFDTEFATAQKVVDASLIDEEMYGLLTSGIVNQDDFFVAHSIPNGETFAGKFDTEADIGCVEGLTCKNYFDETVDLSDLLVCTLDCDFVEFLFDVRTDIRPATDTKFGFKIITQFGGEMTEE